jgi:hypothetical protein
MEKEKPSISEKLKNRVSSLFGFGSVEPESSGVQFRTPREALGKIFNLMVEIEAEKKVRGEIESLRLKLDGLQENKRNRELITALTGRKKVDIKMKMERVEKPAPKEKVKELPGKTPPTPPVPGVPAPTRPAAPVPPTKPSAPTAPPAKPPAPAAPPAKPPAPTSPPAKPPAPAAPTPTAPPVSVAKPPIIPGTVTGGAAISIYGETGAKNKEQAIKKVGQIVPNDPEAGAFSYGIFGMNSKSKTADEFAKQYPQFNLKGQSGSKEFNESWKKAAEENALEFYNAQLDWHEKNISRPLKKDLRKFLPEEMATDNRVISYMSDRRIQYGKVMEQSALKYASDAKTAEEFIDKMTEFDLQNIGKAFPTALKTHGPGYEKGLRNRIENRRKLSLQQVPNPTGATIPDITKENRDMKREMSESSEKIINNVNNISQSSQSPQIDAKKVEEITPPLIRKSRQ